MRSVLLLLALALPAGAVTRGGYGTPLNGAGEAETPTSITTSGDGVIGGQLTVVGTATVQGAAFSVGGATLTVSGGNVVIYGTSTFGGGASSTTFLGHVSISTPYANGGGTVITDQGGTSLTVPGVSSFTAIALGGAGASSCSNPDLYNGSTSRNTGLAWSASAQNNFRLCSNGTTAATLGANGIAGGAASAGNSELGTGADSLATAGYGFVGDLGTGLTHKTTQGYAALTSSSAHVMNWQSSGSTTPATVSVTFPSGIITPGDLNNKTVSSVTIQGTLQVSSITSNGPLWLSTAASAGTITTPNILTNASGQTTFSPTLSSGSFSGSISGTFTQTTLSVCQAGSTQTITLPAGCSGNVLLVFNGTANASVSNSTMTVGVIQDGGFLAGESASKGLVSDGDSGALLNAGFDNNMSFSRIVNGLTCATHSFCLPFMTTSGTGTIESTLSDAKFQLISLP